MFLGSFFIVGGFACCGLLLVLALVAFLIWFWKRQPDQQVSASAPMPPIQATIQHPTAVPVSAPMAPPVPAAPMTSPAPPAPPVPEAPSAPPDAPSADA
jgi:hypothetical protein